MGSFKIYLLIHIFISATIGFAEALSTSNPDFIGKKFDFIFKGYLDIEADQNAKGLKKLYTKLGLYYLSMLSESDFVRPNERNPKKAAAILKEAPTGVYLSVGSERGFIGAALAQNTSHILLVDMDPKVYAFNHLNILLLALSKNREDYLFLRFQATHNEIIERAQQMNFSSENIDFLKDLDVFNFLKYFVRSSFFLRPVSMWAPFSAIAGSIHYMNNTKYFDKLSQLAKSGRIKSLVGNLSSEDDLKRISDITKEWGAKVSVLDISNAWVSSYLNKKTNRTVLGYMSENDLKNLIQKIYAISSPESLLLVTQLDKRYGMTKQVWDYFGIKLSEAEKYSHSTMWESIFPGEGKLGFWQKNSINTFMKKNISSKRTCETFYGINLK